MSTERLFLVNPYDETHLEKIKEFEKREEISIKLSEQLEKLRNSVSKEEYEQTKKEKNEIEENLFLEKDFKIIEMCHIRGEKDIKLAKLNIIPTKTKEKSKKMLSLSTDFIFENWNIEEAFIEIDSSDKGIISYLESQNYENLGEEKGKRIYLKEKPLEKEQKAMIGKV